MPSRLAQGEQCGRQRFAAQPVDGPIAWKHEKRTCAASGYMSGASFSDIAASGASPAAWRCAAALSSHADCARSIWEKVGTRS